jgi:drug/metabolite transporter (DMT)-like permease
MSSWRLFAALYTLGITGYAIGAKLSGGKISPVLGALIMTACSLFLIAGFLIVSKFYGTPFTYNRFGVEAAVAAGISIALADIALFLMYARGAPLSIAGVITEVVSIAVIALVGFIFLKEPVTLTKILGIGFSIIGIALLFKG